MLISNYIKIALRSMRKNAATTMLNLIGLAVSMAAALLIVLFVGHELRVDAGPSRADRLYRLTEIQSFAGITPQHVALSMYPMGPTLMSDFPEVEAFARLSNGPDVVTVEDRQHLIERPARVDPSFIDLFDLPLQSGDPKTALEDPFSLVLTEETAQTLFGTAEAIGRTVTAGDQTYQVTGILSDDLPPSHIRFGALFSMRALNDAENMRSWGSNWAVTYLLLSEGASAASVQARLPGYLRTYMEEAGAAQYELILQPLRDVHLGSSHMTHDYWNEQKFDHQYVYLFILLGIFLLVLAGVNFTNLSTARSALRTREVGVRKAIGARRSELGLQFLSESIVMAFLALVIALALTWIALPFVNALSQRGLHLSTLFEGPIVLGLFLATMLLGLFAGIYPAFFLSSFKPIQALKGATGLAGRKTPLRHTLVVLQFAVAVILIVGATFTLKQLRFMQHRDIGFDKDHVMVVRMSGMANERYASLKEALLGKAGVLGVTASNQRLGNNLHQWGTLTEAQTGEIVDLSISNLVVDFNYFDFYGMELLEGRPFSEERGTDLRMARVVNEAMVAKMGWSDPIGKKMGFGWQDSLGSVIGVAKNFNFNSLHNTVEPLAVSVQDFGYSEASIRIDPARLTEAIAGVEETWNTFVSDRPFEYTFLDAHLDELYRTDQQVSQVVGVVTGLGLLIACLGLLGLAAVTTEQRIKEIGVRKVMGASVIQLVALLSGEYARLVGIAFVIGAPIAFLAVRSWLAGFPYRIDLEIGVFVITGVLTLAVALATVSYRSIQAARANPVDTLRYE